MRKLVFGLLMLTLHVPGYAASQYCSGTIAQILVYDDGGVMIFPSWRKDWVYICNLNSPRAGVSPMVCAAWYATIKAASEKKPLAQTYMFYRDAPACESMPTYNAAPAPGYIMLQ